MKMLVTAKLKPALILGSGFHRHVLGEIGDVNRRTLYDWHHLVSSVAGRMQVVVPERIMPPALRWETLLLRAAKEGYRDHTGQWRRPAERQTHVIEKEARRIVAFELNEAAQNYPQSSRVRIPFLDCWGAVVSLNFDLAWGASVGRFLHSASAAASKGLEQRERRRLTLPSLMPGVDDGSHRSVWFPNGGCFAPETIRMGLHDYGAAPHAVQVAFACLKQWERDSGVTGKSAAAQLGICAHALRHASEGVNDLSDLLGEKPLPLTWVADFLYRPLVFAGVGMSDQESGLWWLLAQRARNLTRTGASSDAFILVHADDRPTFWRTKPFGLTPSFSLLGMKVGRWFWIEERSYRYERVQ